MVLADTPTLAGKKIGIFVWGFPNWSEAWIVNHVVGLRKAGCDARIFALQINCQVPTTIEAKNYRLLESATAFPEVPGNKRRRIQKALQFVLKTGWRSPLVTAQCLNFFRFGMEAASLVTLFRAMPFYEVEQLDLVHCHFGPVGSIASRLKRVRLLNCPLIVSFHGLDVNVIPGQAGEDCYRELFQVADCITAVSKFTMHKLINLGARPESVILWPMGVDTARFSPETQTVTGRPFHFLSVARLVESKGLELAIRALGRVKEKGIHQEFKYTIVGEGPLRQRLASVTDEVGLSENVSFVGTRRHDDLPSLYNQSNAVIVPSVVGEDGTEEAFPVVMLEAFACGRPVVASDVGGIPEAIDDGKNGFLVEPGSIEDLEKACLWLIEHPNESAEMGRRGRGKVVQQYDLDSLIGRIRAEYQRLFTFGV